MVQLRKMSSNITAIGFEETEGDDTEATEEKGGEDATVGINFLI